MAKCFVSLVLSSPFFLFVMQIFYLKIMTIETVLTIETKTNVKDEKRKSGLVTDNLLHATV